MVGNSNNYGDYFDKSIKLTGSIDWVMAIHCNTLNFPCTAIFLKKRSNYGGCHKKLKASQLTGTFMCHSYDIAVLVVPKQTRELELYINFKRLA